MMNLNASHMNDDFDHLFSYERDMERLICPMCGKDYVSVPAFKKHYQKAKDERACLSLVRMFENTMTETFAYENFNELMCLFNRNAKVGLPKFRKSTSYGGMIDLTLMCMEKHIKFGRYIEYIHREKRCRYVNLLITTAMKESNVREFRKFLRHNEHLIDSHSFAEKHHDELESDDFFVLNAFRLGQIGITYLLDHYDLAERLGKCSPGINIQFEELLEEKF